MPGGQAVAYESRSYRHGPRDDASLSIEPDFDNGKARKALQ